jgi:hypothetical protein
MNTTNHFSIINGPAALAFALFTTLTWIQPASAQLISGYSILQNPQVLAGTNILAPTDNRYEVFTPAIGWGNTNNLLVLNQTDTPIAATNVPWLRVTGLTPSTEHTLNALLWYSALNPDRVMAYSYTSSTNAVGGSANFVAFGDRLTNIPTGNPAAVWFAMDNAFSDSFGNLDIYLGGKNSSGYSGWDSFEVQAVPEPSTYALLAVAAAGLAGYRIRRRRRN